MGLRPAKTFRNKTRQSWTRVSKAKPRKSFVKGVPHDKVRQYNMGVLKPYDLEVGLVAEYDVQIRDNAMEAARQAANKFLEKNLAGNYYLRIDKYPHQVLREHVALGVAGADRISKGMKLAFGKPKGRLVRIHAGELLLSARVSRKDLPLIKQALGLAQSKLSGKYKTASRELTAAEKNVQVVEFKQVEVEAPKAAEAVPEAAAPAAQPEEEKQEEGKKK